MPTEMSHCTLRRYTDIPWPPTGVKTPTLDGLVCHSIHRSLDETLTAHPHLHVYFALTCTVPPAVHVCSLTKACPQACLLRNNRGQTPVEAAVSGARGEVLNAMLLACSGSSPRQAGKEEEEKEVRRCLPQQGQGREVLNAMLLA